MKLNERFLVLENINCNFLERVNDTGDVRILITRNFVTDTQDIMKRVCSALQIDLEITMKAFYNPLMFFVKGRKKMLKE